MGPLAVFPKALQDCLLFQEARQGRFSRSAGAVYGCRYYHRGRCRRLHVCLAPPAVADPVQFPAQVLSGTEESHPVQCEKICVYKGAEQGYLGEKKLFANVFMP